MAEHEVAGHKYFVDKLDARKQFDITRRMGFVNYIVGQDVEAQHAVGARWIAAMVANSLATVSQADMDFVLDTCLAVVRVERNNRYVPVWNFQAKAPQFDDLGIDMLVMLELVDLVIQENLAPFFDMLRNQRQTGSQDPSKDTLPSPE